MRIFTFLIFVFIIFCSIACRKNTQTFTDSRDQTAYTYRTFGNLDWMLQNLAFETDSSWCFQNDPEKCKIYGRLYTWYDAMQVCPQGWRLPTQQEWMDLAQLIAQEEWYKKDGGENRLYHRFEPGGPSGLDLQLAGMYDPVFDHFFPVEEIGSYWSSTKFAYHAAVCAVMDKKNGEIFMMNPGTRGVGHSCRCVRLHQEN